MHICVKMAWVGRIQHAMKSIAVIFTESKKDRKQNRPQPRKVGRHVALVSLDLRPWGGALRHVRIGVCRPLVRTIRQSFHAENRETDIRARSAKLLGHVIYSTTAAARSLSLNLANAS